MAEPPPPGDPGPGRALSTLRATAGGLALGLVIDHFKAVQFKSTFTAVVAVLFVLAVLEQLRRLPSGAPLIRLATRGCLLGAAIAAGAAATAPPNWTGVAVLTTAALGLAGSLGPAPPDERWETLANVAFIGVGVAVIGAGVARVRASDLLAGVAAIGVGVAMVGLIMVLLRWDRRMAAWWRTLASAPQQDAGAVRVAEHDGSDRAT